ncbi:hypothetical protein ABBQ38_014660 [Trebouxia sp. C0009 RCD-2024]
MQRQLKPVRVVVRASGGKQVDHAAVKPFRQLGLWTAIDAAATLGSIAGALAFIITSEAVLAGIPVILPLVAWYAGRQKEGLQVEAAIHRAATQWPVQSMTPSAAADSVATALQQLQRDSQQQQIIMKHVKSIEGKLNALEGSVVTAGMNAQDAARQVSTCSDQVAQRTQAQIKDFTTSIQANGLAALQRLDARLTALGDSLAQLERNAGSSMQQSQQEVLDAVSQAQSSLQEAVDRSGQETAEATRALPEAMTAALSAALQKANQPMMLPSTDQVDGQPAFQVSSLASESQQQLRLLVSEELACAVQQINSAQAQAMQQAQQSQQVQQAQQAQQSPQSGLNQAVLDRLSQIEQQLQTGLVSASSSGDNVEMPELLQAVQKLEGLEARLLGALDQKLADLNWRGVSQADCSPLSTADAVPAGDLVSISRPRMPSTQQSMQQQQGEEEDGQQAAYERMQALLESRNSSNARASTSGQDDPTPLPPLAGASMPEQARGDGGASKMQASINPSSIQQQFAFAAGLATADDLPIATPSEIVQLSQVSSSTESKLPPTQQDTESDQQSNTQSASPSNLRPQQPMGRNQQEGQLNPGDDPNQLTDVSQQPGDRAQPEQRGKSEAQLVSGPSPSGSSVAGSSVAGSSASGGSGSGNGSSSSSSDSAVGEGSSADAEVVEVEQMSFGERLQAGLDCFRAGRGEAERGSLGDATRLMTSALSYYEAAAEQDSGSIQLLGNWGNALLAYGSLKKKVLNGVSRAADAGPAAQSAIAASQAQIAQEASAALIAAEVSGHCAAGPQKH